MSIVAKRDRFGFNRVFYHPATGLCGESVRSVLHAVRHHPIVESPPTDAWPPDVEAIRVYLAGSRWADRTVLQGVHALPPGQALIRHADPGVSDSLLSVHKPAVSNRPKSAATFDDIGGLKRVLLSALQTELDSGRNIALALSGGLDSALLLALLRELGADHVPAYILTTRMPEYDELNAAMDMADRWRATIRVVKVDADDFVAALPRAVQHVEEPMYNMHPVAKLLLADAMAADGIDIALSGDGADQVLSHDDSADYLPLCKALFGATSVRLAPPFLDETVVDYLTALPVDPNKTCLRALAEKLNLPPRLVRGPKHSRLAPAFDLQPWMPRDRITALADTLDIRRPALDSDSERMLWTSLLLCLEQLHAVT